MAKQISLDVNLHKPSGQYRKRIRGKDHYLGTDKAEAQRRLAEKIHGFRVHNGLCTDGSMMLKELSKAYFDDLLVRMSKGIITRKTVQEYQRIIKGFSLVVGSDTKVSSLRPSHFTNTRLKWRSMSPFAINKYVISVRTMFKWAVDNKLLAEQPSYGNDFDRVQLSQIRTYRVRRNEVRGYRKFTPDELKAILAHDQFGGVLRACILLAMNTGMYAADCGDLLWGDIRRVEGVAIIDRSRFKTKAMQRAVLWPETIEAIEALRTPAWRPDGFVFRQQNGSPVTLRESDSDVLSKWFHELYKTIPGTRRGIGFGAFRHTHTSAVGGMDNIAAKLTRGHTVDEVEGAYDMPSITRLAAIAEAARAELYLPNLPRACTVRLADSSPAAAQASLPQIARLSHQETGSPTPVQSGEVLDTPRSPLAGS